jgi:hypothetical protein
VTPTSTLIAHASASATATAKIKNLVLKKKESGFIYSSFVSAKMQHH